MKKYKILPILLLLLAVYSCRKDYVFVPKPPAIAPIDTTTAIPLVSFSTQIVPIFTTNCGISNCHNTTSKVAGLDLSGATTAYTTLFTKNEIDTVANKSTPELNKLYVKISPGKSMEKYLKNPATERPLILKWLTEGARNN